MRIAGPENAIHCRQKPPFECGTGTVRWTSDSETCPADLAGRQPGPVGLDESDKVKSKVV